LIGAAISISNNIAEGFKYNSNKQLIKYLGIAKGSAGELRSQLYLLQKAGKISLEVY
jgi:four helix bundle protein